MINEENLNKKIKEADGVLCGIDYVQINLKMPIPFLSEILHRLDADNSNIHFDSVGEYQLAMTKQYSKRGPVLNISVSIEGVPYPILQYMEYSDQQKQILKSSGKFVYYGTYFRLIETNKLESFFEVVFFKSCYKQFKKESISRLDFKIDFFYSKQRDIIKLEDLVNIRSNVKKRNHIMMEKEHIKYCALLKNLAKVKDGIPIEYNIQSQFLKGPRITGWDYGSKSNKSLYFRMYDKLLDTLAKGKEILYDDYFKYESVYRFEIEFRIKFNKKQLPTGRMETYKVGELWKLKEKIERYLGFKSYDVNEKFIYQYNKNETTDFSEKSRYQVDFGGRGYVLAMSGFNPFISLHKTLERKNLNGALFKNLVHNYIDFISELCFLEELGTKV